MKSEKLIELIHHPEKIGSDDLRELDDLVSRYPYFQTVRILYLKALYMLAAGRFRNELKTSTVHISDHKQLFRFLNQQISFDLNTRQPIYNELTNIVDERLREISGHTIVTSQGIPAYPETQGAIYENEEEEIVSLDLSQNGRKQRSKRPERPAFTDTHVVSNPIMLDDIPGVIDDYNDAEKNSPETEKRDENIPYIIDSPFAQDIPDLSGIPGMIEEETTTAVTQEDSPVLSMNLDLEEEEETVPTAKASTEKASFETPEILSGGYRLADKKAENDAAQESGGEKPKRKYRKKKDELIEQFIIAKPSMPKITAALTENRDLSKENPYDKEELFSETLAKIYVRQHLYEKAIATYIKLSLKYPEKSVYFADRIEKIKENINNKE